MRKYWSHWGFVTSLVLAAACWGWGAVMSKYALDQVPPLTLLVLQLVVSVALLWVGLHNQRTYASATLRGVGPDAAAVVAQLRRYLRAPTPVHWGRANAVGRTLGAWRCCAGKEGTA